MKKYIIGFVVVLLLLVISWLLWIDVDGNKRSQNVVQQQSTNIPSNTSSERLKWRELLESTAKEQTLPIEFWGCILDQNNEPVRGAQLEISVSYPDIKVMDTRFKKLQMQSDERGEFRVGGVKGSGLTIDLIKKEGYILTPNFGKIFSYAYYNSVPKYQYKYDPNNPVIFRMWKKMGGEKLIKGDDFYYMGQDGRIYTFDLLKQERIKGEGIGDIKISFRRSLEVNNYDKYDWSFEIEGIDGGLIETNDEFLYLAPESGYQKKCEYKQQASASDWKSQLNKSYYVKSRNGQVYACVKIRVYAKYNDTAAIGIEYYANPSGSRNLER